MKICICCSLTFTNEVSEIAKMLESMGHEVLLPNGVINRLALQPGFDPVRAKIDTDACRAHVDKIRAADAVLVCNFLKNCTPGYIGANTFAEMFAAHYFEKPIFALYALPLAQQKYISDELESFEVKVLDGELGVFGGETTSTKTAEPKPVATVETETKEVAEPEEGPAESAEVEAKTTLRVNTQPLKNFWQQAREAWAKFWKM